MRLPNLLYIRTAKTASSSVSEWCAKRFIFDTINTRWLTQEHNQRLLLRYQNYFTTVRNPYRRAYSQFKFAKSGILYASLVKEGWDFSKEFETFKDFLKYDVENNLSDLYNDEKTHLTPVSYYLKDILHQIKYILKVEELDQKLPELVKEFDLEPHEKLRIVYTTPYEKNELDDVYKSKELRDLVYERYKDDFINFNYDKDDYKNLYPEKL